MYSGLISDCAERAISDDWEGAATAASGSAADTGTLSESVAVPRPDQHLSRADARHLDAIPENDIETGNRDLNGVSARQQPRDRKVTTGVGRRHVEIGARFVTDEH